MTASTLHSDARRITSCRKPGTLFYTAYQQSQLSESLVKSSLKKSKLAVYMLHPLSIQLKLLPNSLFTVTPVQLSEGNRILRKADVIQTSERLTERGVNIAKIPFTDNIVLQTLLSSAIQTNCIRDAIISVSYTHLTLPTIYSV
eukprot:TRINITY_DN7756_c0_g1_i2.p1 TRINITY_DN7756_c0_g1~~TRINITY_DN7756_c0_g1_i2.p1  ORF type:complete len:144 (+),score=4.16 TRINITY_DN7756_c0_g1_i2:399-830(+)